MKNKSKRKTAEPSDAPPLAFRKLTEKFFDFELKPDQSILFLPYTAPLYDKLNQVYWLYFVVTTPGKPNVYYRCSSYDLYFSRMNIEQVNAKYGAVGIGLVESVHNCYLNTDYTNVNGNFIMNVYKSVLGYDFIKINTVPQSPECGEDMSFYTEGERMYLFQRNLRPQKEKRRQALRYSDDFGQTWSDKVIVLEIPESERTKPHGVFQYCVVYSMTVCKHLNKYYSAVNVYNEATEVVSVKLAQSDDLYNWEWLNGGQDIIPQGSNNQTYGAIFSYVPPGVDDALPKLMVLTQSTTAKHNEAGIFRLNFYEQTI